MTRWQSPLLGWLCLTLAAAYGGLVLGSGPAEMQQPDAALPVYWAGLAWAAGGAALVCAGLLALGKESWLPRLARASLLMYLAVFSAFGLPFAVPLALGGVALAARWPDPPGPVPPVVLAVHAMGTLMAWQVAWVLPRYLVGLGPFRAVLRSLLALLGG